MLHEDTVHQLQNILADEREGSKLQLIINSILELNQTLLEDRIDVLEKQLHKAEELLDSY
jgi:hypothetical protein